MTPRQSQRNTVALANADYENRKAERKKLSVRAVERIWKLKAGQLTYFRANLAAGRTTAIDVEY